MGRVDNLLEGKRQIFMNPHLSIGFVGLGKLGEPMAHRLLSSGHQLTAYARRDDVRRRISTRGATLVDSVVDLADRDVVISCLFDDHQLTEVCSPLIQRMRPGAIFVSHTTGSPDTTGALRDLRGNHGAAIVEAPFSGTAEAVRDGELTVLLAGPATVLDDIERILRAYAATIVRTGSLGSALAVKLLNNALFAANTQLLLSVVDVARSLGIADGCLFNALTVSSGGSRAVTHIVDSGRSTDDYGRELARYLDKDVTAARQLAARLGIELTCMNAAIASGPLELTTTSRSS